MANSKFSQSQEAILDLKPTPSKKQCSTGFLSCIPTRYVLTLMLFIGSGVIYTIRVNINIAIVAMVRSNRFNSNQTDDLSDICPPDEEGSISDFNSTSSNVQLDNGETMEVFDWSLADQGFILGGFYYGYVASNLIGGRLSEKFGPKVTFLGGIFASSLLTFLVPLAARSHMAALVVIRALIGVAQGITFPAIFTFFPIWYPQKEIATHLAIAMAGLQVGTIVAMPVAGYFCEHVEIVGGWPAVFYVFGVTGCLYSFIAYFVMYTRPEDHPNISATELKLIKAEKKPMGLKKPAVPWRKLLTSAPVWALVTEQSTSVYVFHVILTRIPAYLDDVLNYSVQDNGVANSAMYFGKAATTIFIGYVSDVIVRKKFFGRSVTRKIIESIAMVGSGTLLCIIPLMRCNADSVIILLAFAMAIAGFNCGGNVPCTTEMAPAFAGTIFGICNTFAAATGFIAPQVVAWLLGDKPESLTQWSYVFFSTGGVAFLGVSIFVIFGSANQQKWAETKEDQEETTVSSNDEKF